MKTSAPLLLAVLLLSGCAARPVSAPGAAPLRGEDGGPVGPAAQDKLYLGVVEGLIRQQRYQAAIAFLARYQKTQPSTPRFRKLTADALNGAGRYGEAIAGYRGLLNTGYAAQAHAGIASARAAQGDWRAAEENFRQAALLDPANASYLNNLGYARLRQKLAGPALYPAVEALQRAHELAPDSALILDNLALAQARAGRQTQLAALLDTIADNSRRKQVASFAMQASAPPPAAANPAVPASQGNAP